MVGRKLNPGLPPGRSAFMSHEKADVSGSHISYLTVLHLVAGRPTFDSHVLYPCLLPGVSCLVLGVPWLVPEHPASRTGHPAARIRESCVSYWGPVSRTGGPSVGTGVS